MGVLVPPGLTNPFLHDACGATVHSRVPYILLSFQPTVFCALCRQGVAVASHCIRW